MPTKIKKTAALEPKCGRKIRKDVAFPHIKPTPTDFGCFKMRRHLR